MSLQFLISDRKEEFSLEVSHKQQIMKTSDRPPIRHKKGIHVVQPPHLHPKINTHLKESQTGSSRTMGRSRGISTSRQSGITIDKIYLPQHFLPPKSPQNSIKKSECQQMKTLNSVRSLKLVSVFADSNAGSMQASQSSKKRLDEIPKVEFELRRQNQQQNDIRCNSPILKLKSHQQEIEKVSHKSQSPFLPNLLKF